MYGQEARVLYKGTDFLFHDVQTEDFCTELLNLKADLDLACTHVTIYYSTRQTKKFL